MKQQVPWTKTILEDFVKEGLLTEDEEFIMRTRVAGWSQVKQAMERNISNATVSNIVKRVKEKYDNLSKQFPDRFPERKVSKVEEMLDDTEHDYSFVGTYPCRTCHKNIDNMSASELLDCMNNCKYKKFIN